MIYYLFILLLVGLDQLIKWWTVATLPLGEGTTLIKGVIGLYYIQNRGAAWGILAGHMLLFYVITVVVVMALAYKLHQNYKITKYSLDSTALALIIAGALGNFIDRIRLNYVIDMFHFEFFDFPIFNFADACITVGVILLILHLLFFDKGEWAS